MNLRISALVAIASLAVAGTLDDQPAQAQFSQQAKLVGTDADAIDSPNYQGVSVSLSGDGNTAIVGGSGDNNGFGAAESRTEPTLHSGPLRWWRRDPLRAQLSQ